jgi:hypothetical protein
MAVSKQAKDQAEMERGARLGRSMFADVESLPQNVQLFAAMELLVQVCHQRSKDDEHEAEVIGNSLFLTLEKLNELRPK